MPIDPITGSAIIGGAASLIGNLFGSSSTSSTNKTNLKIAQMNNEFNERMMQKQMDYNIEMWNRQNEYNTPAAQVQRLRHAGLNPALMMGQGQTGMAQSAGGVSAPTAQSVTMQPFHPDFSGVGSAAAQYMQNKLASRKIDAEIGLTRAQADSVYIENQFRAAKALGELYEQESRIQSNKSKTAYQNTINKYADQLNQSQLQTELYRRNNIEADTKLKVQQSMMNSLTLAKMPQALSLRLSQMATEILLKRKQGIYTQAQAEKALQDTYEAQCRAAGLDVSKENEKDFLDDVFSIAGNIFTGLFK